MELLYITAKLKKHLDLYDGTYETMRNIRTYFSIALNTSTDGKTNVSILSLVYSDMITKIMSILEEHGQSIVSRDKGIWIYTSDGKVFAPIREVPELSLSSMIKYRVRFPELEPYL